MLKRYAALGAAVAALAAGLAAATPATTGVSNSSDREAPRVIVEPTLDNTDTYAFSTPDAPGKVVTVADFDKLGGGPTFSKLSP